VRHEQPAHSSKLSRMTDRIAMYNSDIKNEAKMKREQEDRRAAMLREQVLKCEKDLLDECELRQEGDRMVENKLLNHIHTLEKNMRDASQRLVAMIEPFIPRFKHLEMALETEREARKLAVDELREDLREAIAMTAGVASRAHGGANSEFGNNELEALKVAQAAAQARHEEQQGEMRDRVAVLEKELEEERNARTNDRRQLEEVIRSVMHPSFELVKRRSIEFEQSLTEKMDQATQELRGRLEAESAAGEANAAGARSIFQNELDKRARMQSEATAALERQVAGELAAIKAAAEEQRRLREKAEEEIINNLGDAILSMRVVS